MVVKLLFAQQPSDPFSARITVGILMVLATVLIFLSMCQTPARAEVVHKKHVLVLNSYHQGLSWTDNIVKGIESVLRVEGKDIDIHYEYMDTKRYFDEHYFAELHALYKYKYRNDKFDVVIVSDNDAFNFARTYHDDLFPATPVVFCGVNNYKDSMLDGHKYFTGVVEETDVKSTIEIALKLHPDVKRIVVVNDKTTTGIAMKNEIMEVVPFFKGSVGFDFLEDFDIEELQDDVREIPSNSIILLSVVNRDRTGNFFAYEESLAFIYKESKVPIYSFWDFYLGGGIVGGMLTSGFQQGKSAAEIALRILQGGDVAVIPVVGKSPNRYMFDSRELQRYGIKRSSLPKESIVINLPDSLYSKYKVFILGSSVTIFTLSIIIFVLIVNISLRKKVEQALRDSEGKYRDLYDTAPDMYHSVNREGIIIDCNETEARMLGYKKEEIIGKPIIDFFSAESMNQYEKEFPKLKERTVFHGIEREFIRRDGTIFLASLNVFVEIDAHGELVRTKTVGRDITEHRRMGEELMSSRDQLRNLSAHLLSVREEERRHIAREIHDELGVVLSTLRLDLSWLKNRLSKDNSPLVEKTEKMSDLVDETIGSVQKISSELRPGVLDHLGLSAAIEWQAEEFRNRTGIDCEVTIDEDIVLDQNRCTAVFRIFQETLTNVIRHSKATRVKVNLRERKNALVLEVRDNGIGITQEQISNPKSFGIIGIRERAHFLGGEVNIDGIPDKGTTVTVTIPLNERPGGND
jgi:PAS domain S-box-containing protein